MLRRSNPARLTVVTRWPRRYQAARFTQSMFTNRETQPRQARTRK